MVTAWRFNLDATLQAQALVRSYFMLDMKATCAYLVASFSRTQDTVQIRYRGVSIWIALRRVLILVDNLDCLPLTDPQDACDSVHTLINSLAFRQAY